MPQIPAPTSRPADLPDFDRPPVDEVVLSLQFASTKFRNIHSGLLWDRLRGRYPTVEEFPPIDPVFETFGLPPSPQPLPQIQLMRQFPTSRFWFVTQDGTELLQIQPDRLIHNWRKRTPLDEYPRYESLRDRFHADVVTVQEYWREMDIGAISVNQCEVTYINNIFADDGAHPLPRFEEVFSFWRDVQLDPALGEPERRQFSITHVFRGENGVPLGRLHIAAQPAVHLETSAQLVQFTLSARGKPTDETVEAAFAWLDIGRAIIVRAFTALTLPAMHNRWRRKHV